MLLINATLATMAPDDGFGLMPDGAIAMQRGRIVWVGPARDAPDVYRDGPVQDIDGRLVTPGLIDCHGHVVFGGHRAAEFELRQNGARYEEIARAGGGIMLTVNATRDAGEAALLKDALTRVDAMICEGVTTLEVKSGYGLDQETELKMLRLARKIGQERPLHVVTTFLGAHAVPSGHDPGAYIDDMCIPTLRAAHAK
ncbi:MAG: imidazolonepropionase, partial [Pseudomonadota bacterium]